MYNFGCVEKETNLFKSQKADGILGMARGDSGGKHLYEPVYEVMYREHLIEERVFSLCLGTNGGYLQIAGFNGAGHLYADGVKWTQMREDTYYRVTLKGMSMNDHYMEGTDRYFDGFVDSGTTISYFPHEMFNTLKTHFRDWFCPANSFNCAGDFQQVNVAGAPEICFSYTESFFPEGPLKYFATFPILKFRMTDIHGEDFNFEWFPSEYLYRYRTDLYCVAAESQQSTQVLIGGSMLR